MGWRFSKRESNIYQCLDLGNLDPSNDLDPTDCTIERHGDNDIYRDGHKYS
jgi:hypothetical protein